MLTFGSRDALHIRTVDFPLGLGITLLYASDLHLTQAATHIIDQLTHAADFVKPSVILLGGDLVDCRNGLHLLQTFIRAQTALVYAIPGNHDYWVGLDRVRQSIEDAGAEWLTDVQFLSPALSISGLCHAAQGAFPILCAHDPAIFPQAVACRYRLILAGHLHGGQWVLNTFQDRFYPGAWFYRWNGARFEAGESVMLVSRGVHDTLPIRWNCPREVLVCRF